jgi:hypothetical protein
VSISPIYEAKQRLPLPLLMRRLGLGDHAKKNALCPFHDDRNPSFSIFQQNGMWFWKCHAGCQQGDEITLLQKLTGVTRFEATKLFLEMAGCASVAHPLAVPRDNSERTHNKGFDWQACVEAFGDEHVEQLCSSRGISREICSWLHQNRLVGSFKGKIAFPVHDGTGKVVGAHYKTTAGSWQYYPKGVKAQPLVVGELEPGSLVYVFESQWDGFAFMDSSGERSGILITRGASNAARVAELLPQGSTVYAWTQNDAAGEKWQEDICEHAKAVNATVKRVKIPKLHKDLNDWTRAGATADDLLGALMSAEVISPKPSDKPVLIPGEPVNLAGLLDETVNVLQQNITFSSEHQAVVVALWVAHTHAIEQFDTTPYLHISSPVKRCGKSNLLSCLKYLAAKAWHVVTPSVPVLYRKIQRDCPTLLLDEADRSFDGGEKGKQDLLAVLNSGYKRGATVDRCGGANRDKLESFAVFCPKAFAGIGGLPDTTQDRCLPIRLERQVRGRCRRFLEAHVERQMTPIRDGFAEWAKTEDAINKLSVTILDHAFPKSLSDRAVEVCDPLFKIAIAAGSGWYKRIREATAAIFGAEEDENQTTSQLAAIRDAFQNDERVSTSELIDRLLQEDESPFPNWWLREDNKKAVGKSLARILRPFGVKAKKFRIDGEQVRGYERAELQRVWDRYCTPTNNAHANCSDLDVLDVSPSVNPNT